MRPAVFQVGGTLYWVMQTRNPDTMVLKDADSTPTVAVRKNGSSVGDSVTVTKRSATTGIYDCSYNPAAEVEGDAFTFEESATVTGTTTSSATYTQTWNARVIAVERGTDSANTTTPPTAAANASAVRTELATELARVDVAISTRSTFAGGAVASVTGNVGGNVTGSVGSVVGAVVLDSATATQIDTIEAALTTLGSDSTTVERSVSDTNAITFSWPVSGATITGTASLNNGSYGAVAGAIAFLRTETGRHYYTLAYNVADRPAAEGQVRYKFVDGTYTGYVVLRTVNLVTTAQVNAQVLDVLSVDTFGELSSPPAATSSLKDKLVWLFMWARNKATATATERKLYADDTTTIVSTETITDDGTTFTKGESL